MEVLCNHCGMCCRVIPVDIENNILVRDGFQVIDDNFAENLIPISLDEAMDVDLEYVERIQELFPDISFCKCRHLTDENKCGLGTLPALCNKFPSSPLAFVPDCCGYLGAVFLKNEELKRKIRMIKEEILDYESLIASGDKDSASYKKIIENLTRFITKYNDFGSQNW